MNFLTQYEVYATEIYYHNKEFTPKELVDYFIQIIAELIRQKIEEE